MTSQILTIRQILEGVCAKNLGVKILFVKFSKAFDTIHRGKMEQILLAYGLPKETVAAIMMLYRNMKVKVCSPDGDTDYFDIVVGVLLGDTIDKVKDNGFKLTKERSRRYPIHTITDTDYANDIVLLANTPAQVETLLHSLEQEAADIGLHVNTHKMEYMCFNQRSDIFTLNSSSLKLVDKFTFLRTSVSSTSTETDINMQLAKVWTAINRLLVI